MLSESMTTAVVRLHRWDEIALEKVTEMLSRKIVTGERGMLAQVYLKAGCVVPMHSHESEQMTYILQGALRFLVGGEEITVREGDARRDIVLGSDPLAIGRDPQNDITLDDRRVSRKHAEIRLRLGRYTLYDLQSTNGTYVNGRRVAEVVLADGDRLSIGGVELEFRASD